jgi:Mrp family chromosome partitioning ATPase
MKSRIEPVAQLDVPRTDLVVVNERSLMELLGRSDNREIRREQELMVGLYQQLAVAVASSPNKVLQFIGPEGGEGVTTIARRFGCAAVATAGKKVLILEGGLDRGRSREFFSVLPSMGWSDVTDPARDMDKAIYQVGNSTLYMSPYAIDLKVPVTASLADRIEGFLNVVRKKFDLIIVDSTPALGFDNSLLVSPKVDGVVLVLEAERTTVDIAEMVKEKITEIGGNVVGVVLNRHRDYMPGFLSKLF